MQMLEDHFTERSTVSSVGSCEDGPDFQLDVSSSLAGLRYGLERRYSDGFQRKSGASQGEIHGQNRGSLGRTASASSSNVREDLVLITRQTRLYLQLDELRTGHLADLWDIFKKFEYQLLVYVNPLSRTQSVNKNRDACVVGVIDFHIDELRQLIVVLVASEESLATWFTEANFIQLRRQIRQYLSTFHGDLFWTAFPETVVRHLQSGLRDFASRVTSPMPVENVAHVNLNDPGPERALYRSNAASYDLYAQEAAKNSPRTREEDQTSEKLLRLDELTGCSREREFGSHCKRLKTLIATYLGSSGGGDDSDHKQSAQIRADRGASSGTGEKDFAQAVCVDSRKLHTCGVVLGAFSYTDFRSRLTGFGSFGEMFQSLLEVA